MFDIIAYCFLTYLLALGSVFGTACLFKTISDWKEEKRLRKENRRVF
jgi:hypothetical protein